jgi:CMP-N-acetylneuraminic acid synthetase
MGFLGIIPARGGSKGVPRKNIADLGGKPLIAWTIEAAMASGVLDRIIVSTDDDEIAKTSLAYGAAVPFRRPAVLAVDEAESLSVVRHAIEQMMAIGESFTAAMLLQPTSPFRSAADIQAVAALAVRLDGERVQSVVSVTQVGHDPRWSFTLDSAGFLRPLFAGDRYLRRQDGDKVYQPNGAIYVAAVEHLLTGGTWYDDPVSAYTMPETRSLDIDTLWHLELARSIAGRISTMTDYHSDRK